METSSTAGRVGASVLQPTVRREHMAHWNAPHARARTRSRWATSRRPSTGCWRRPYQRSPYIRQCPCESTEEAVCGRGGTDPPSDLPPGNQGSPALPWAALAAATRPSRVRVACMVSLGRTAVCRAVGRGPARCSGDVACQAPRMPQSPQGRAHAHGAHPGRSGVGVAHHHASGAVSTRGMIG